MSSLTTPLNESLGNRLRKLWRDDGLSIAFFTLFILCLIPQGLTGWVDYNGSLKEAHFPAISLGAYLRTGNFLDGAFSNWQAAILQLAVLIAFSAVLRQKGAAHSRKPAGLSQRTVYWKLRRQDNLADTLYANSLSLAFIFMFVIAFGLHLLFGSWRYNEQQTLQHLPTLSTLAYAGSADFWFSVFQCWEAEFGAIGLYVVLSIFLRQENSPESKKVEAQDGETGETNE
ncbi:DUF6766 family protein [Acidocella facilis]|uniref:DUF6766 family protein n=1 Tax=Acidocella facilis TaxID=525 RepID=UPI001F42A4AA|nr:DUF6766 family protein [Acidocella facilis]